MTKLISTNPAKNYEVLGAVDVSTANEIKQKVDAARKAKTLWKELGVAKRIELLRQVRNLFIKRKEELALLITREVGKPIKESLDDLNWSVDYFKWFLDNGEEYLSDEITFEDQKSIHKIIYEPIGVAAVIVPWNFPFDMFLWGVIPNLISGNTVVFKHSEECPLFGKLLEEIINDCDLPESVFSEVYGDRKVGDFLVHQDINLISFTGSTKVGKYLYKVAADKFIKAVMELGGSAPGIVFADADLDAVIEIIYLNRFTNCGQMCDALKRLIVHESRFDEVIEKLKKKIQSVKVGNPEDEATEIGSLVAKRQLELLEAQMKDALDKGAKVIVGGKRPTGLQGAYYEPTILTDITREMWVWQEEVFGPVLPIVPFDTDEKAVRMANDTKYGLGSYIYTKNKRKALQIASQIDAGMVSINNASYIQPCSPFGGYKESGIGKEHGKFGFRELTQIKVVALEK